MRETRTAEEKLIDDALSLVLLSKAQESTSEQDAIGNRIKVMKLLFLAGEAMFSERAKGLNFCFYRYTRGPFSKEVEESWDELKQSGHLWEDEEFQVTDSGRELARAFEEDVLKDPSNKLFFDVIDGIATKHGASDQDELLDLVYRMTVSDVTGKSIRINDAPMGTQFTLVLEPEEASTVLSIEEGWIDTLLVELNRERRESLAHAISGVRDGRTRRHDELWPNV